MAEGWIDDNGINEGLFAGGPNSTSSSTFDAVQLSDPGVRESVSFNNSVAQEHDELIEIFSEFNDDELVEKAASMFARDINGNPLVDLASIELLKSVLSNLVSGEAPSASYEFAEGSAIGRTAHRESLINRISVNATTFQVSNGELDG